MSVLENKKTGKFDVRVTVNGTRTRKGSYDTRAEADYVEQQAYLTETASKYEAKVMDFEQPDQSLVRVPEFKWFNPFKFLKKRKKA